MTTAQREVRLEIMEGPQWDFVHSKARHPGYFGGRGAGKTTAAVLRAFLRRMNYPKSMGCITEPTYPQVRDVLMPTIRRLFGVIEGDEWAFKRADMEIQFKNGSVLLLRPADAFESIRGLNLSDFDMDEVAQGRQEETFLLLQGCLREASGAPHAGSVASTPKGLRHWTAHRWKWGRLPNGEEVPREEYPIFTARTKDNFHLDRAFYESLVTSYGDGSRFAQQELEGEFVAFEGQAFPEFDEDKHTKDAPVGMTFNKRIVGLDWGAVRPTAAVEVCVEGNRVWVTREFYKRRCHEDELVETLAEWDARVFCDPAAKDTIDFLRKNGINATKARSNSFSLRTRLVGARLANGGSGPGLFVSPRCPNLIEELQTLSYAKPRGMDVLTDKWEVGMDDHAFDALSYALMDIDAGRRGRPQAPVIYRRWGHFN